MSTQTQTGTATTTLQTFTFSPVQNVFKLENKGSTDIQFNVGKYTNKTLHAYDIFEARVDYESFDVITNDGTSEFEATLTNDVVDLLEVDAQVENNAKFEMLSGIDVDTNYTGVIPLVYHESELYGLKDNNMFVTSIDEGETWVDLIASPVGSVHSIKWCNDGEVLICNTDTVQKSNGFPGNDTTWTTKITKSAPAGNGIVPWGFDGNGSKFIVTEYSGADRGESRYIWISTDCGENFDVVYDKYVTDPTNTSHMHGVCYNPEMDLFFVSHGHGVLRGIEYSTDNGTTWEKLQGEFTPDASPTYLYSLPTGVVLGSDATQGGLYGIPIQDKPENLRMIKTARWSSGQNGVIGFAYSATKSVDSNHVFMGFTASTANVSTVIMGGTPNAGSMVWESETLGEAKFLHLVATPNHLLSVVFRGSNYEYFKSKLPSEKLSNYDEGNVLNGVAKYSTTIVVGPKTNTDATETVLMGANAKMNGTDAATIIGANAEGTTRCVVIGKDSDAQATDSIIIGQSIVSNAILSVAIGGGALVTDNSTYGMAIGANSEADGSAQAIGGGSNAEVNASAVGHDSSAGSHGVVLGREATCGTYGAALGYQATASHVGSVAIGRGSVTTQTNQVMIKDRHLAMMNVPSVPDSTTNEAFFYVRDNGSGKRIVCVKLGTQELILATEA